MLMGEEGGLENISLQADPAGRITFIAKIASAFSQPFIWSCLQVRVENLMIIVDDVIKSTYYNKTTDFKKRISKTTDFKKQQISKHGFQKQQISTTSYCQKQQIPKSNRFQKTTNFKKQQISKTTDWCCFLKCDIFQICCFSNLLYLVIFCCLGPPQFVATK